MKEAIHKACIRDFTTYETAEQETDKFVLGVVKDTWVQELIQAKTYYTLVTEGQLLTHVQSTCGGLYALDVLRLKNEMQYYHLESGLIPEYIKAL